MSEMPKYNSYADFEWAKLQVYEKHLHGWHGEEWAYRQACHTVMEEEGYVREVWELAPYIAYMMLSRHFIESEETGEEMEEDIMTTIEALKSNLPLVLAEADRLQAENRQITIDLQEAERVKSLKRSEARKRRKAEKEAKKQAQA
jgi:hypothetical protein